MKMNKDALILLLLSGALFLGTETGAAYTVPSDTPPPLEEVFTEIGYNTVPEAVNELEKHFEQSLKLPLRVPPIEFTHCVGRFSNLEGEVNDSFEMKYISDKHPENHYKINVRPVKHKIPIKDRYVLETFELRNKNKAIYMTISGFNVLVFEKDNWQYMISIDKRVSDKVTPEILVEIADSIGYVPQRKK